MSVPLIESIEQEVLESEYYPRETFENLQIEETIDLLDNFGYVSFQKNKSTNERPDDEAIQNGIRKFRIELKNSLVKEDYDFLINGYSQDLVNKNDPELSENELDVLADLSDIEGEFRLSRFSLSDIKNDKILSRILHYRLSILGINSEIKSLNDSQTKKDLAVLESYLGVKGKALIELTDDFSLLIQKAATADHKESFRNLAFFRFSKRRFNEINSKDLQFRTSTKLFKEQLKVLPENDQNFFAEFKDNKKKIKKTLKTHVQNTINEPINDFYIRLTQIKFWLIGTYNGDLDGNMRGFSVESIIDLYALAKELEEADHDETEHEEEFLNPQKIILRLGQNNLWALNYRYLFLVGLKQFEEEFEDRENIQNISENLIELIAKAKEDGEKEILNVINESVIQDGEEEKKRNKRRKKKYRKGKGIFNSVGRIFKKVGKWVVHQIGKALKALKAFFKAIKNGILHLLREIKEAVGRVIRGIKFFFSRRQIKTQDENSNVLITDFDFDFDVRNDLSAATQETLVDRHLLNIKGSVEDLKTALKFFEVAIPLVIQLASGPVGWIKAGIQLVKMLIRKKVDHGMNLKFI